MEQLYPVTSKNVEPDARQKGFGATPRAEAHCTGKSRGNVANGARAAGPRSARYATGFTDENAQ
ncbi:MAG: hypothetical protein EPN70_19900 [Paraburkholderia sp.]|uniref:hypothetical protein n=1 Tax=Paraburkholderia sp. TaxID=1926495 RepID=UPI001208EC24|nr:hypothetical protein [Paraburkholderia sp.]TAM01318.1 MAG: hypothetical protein EPN70_19900 [Paraburkholderia sp.]TAM28111.1 MAG: hypothetical protein EPN59_18275 [Paraburkholderia sp.]